MIDFKNMQKLIPIQSEDLEKIIETNSSNSQLPINEVGKMKKIGMSWPRLFDFSEDSEQTSHPYDQIKWEMRTAKITKGDGKIVFEQKEVVVPELLQI